MFKTIHLPVSLIRTGSRVVDFLAVEERVFSYALATLRPPPRGAHLTRVSVVQGSRNGKPLGQVGSHLNY